MLACGHRSCYRCVNTQLMNSPRLVLTCPVCLRSEECPTYQRLVCGCFVDGTQYNMEMEGGLIHALGQNIIHAQCYEHHQLTDRDINRLLALNQPSDSPEYLQNLLEAKERRLQNLLRYGTEIEVKHTNLREWGNKIAEIMNTNPRLSRILLRNCALNDQTLKSMIPFMKNPLTRLSLSYNMITDEGAAVLLDYVKNTSAMHSLGLRKNLITKAAPFQRELQNHKGLRTLDLACNQIGSDAITMFHLAAVNMVINSIDLTGNLISCTDKLCIDHELNQLLVRPGVVNLAENLFN